MTLGLWALPANFSLSPIQPRWPVYSRRANPSPQEITRNQLAPYFDTQKISLIPNLAYLTLSSGSC